MMSRVAITVCAAMVGVGQTGVAQERKIERTQLPAAVERAVAAQSQGATIRGFSQETEHGQTFYEVEMTVSGHGKDVLMDPTGAVVEVEEEVAWNALPAPVQAGVKGKAGGGKIGKVESITKQGKLVAYEAQVTTDGKRSEVQVGPGGEPLAHEE